MTWLLALAGVHLAALAGVLLMSKYSAVLVDEDGRPVGDPGSWQEHVVASHDGTLTITPGR